MSSTLRGLSSKSRPRKTSWQNFEISGVPVEILRGSICQFSVKSFVRGSQCTACAVTAISLSALTSVSDWKSETIDHIIHVGTRRHESCDDKDKDNNGFADVSSFVKFTEIEGYKGNFRLQEKLTSNGSMEEDFGQVLQIPGAAEILSDFMNKNWQCVVTLNGYSVGVINQGDFCFLFNSHPCNGTGKPDPKGFGCVIKIPAASGPEIMESLISANYGPKQISKRNLNSCVYCIVGLTVELVQAPISGPKTSRRDTEDAAKMTTIEEDSDDGDFDPRKSKLPERMPIAGATLEFDITKISGGFHVYKMAPLPARYEEVIPTFFRNLNPNLVSTKCVPYNVIQNDLIVVYSARAMQSASDFYWRKDGYSWSSGSHNILPKRNPQVKVTYHYLRTDANEVLYTRTEISPLAVTAGKFDWTQLQQHKWPVVLVHYKGKGNLLEVKCLPHGNRKYTPQKQSNRRMTELITNTPSTPEFQRDYELPPNDPKSNLLRENIKRKLAFTSTPYQAFTVQRAESDAMDPDMASLFDPRNVEQIKSVKATMKKDASFDDPVQLLVHHSIVHKELLPIYARENGYLHVVAALPQLDAHFNELVASRKKIIFHYDTTFNCGDYYLSILTFRHELLQDSPVIPLRFLFHENKSTFGHDLLFQNLLKTFPILKKADVVFVTDREASFKNMKKQHLPAAIHIFCHLHILRNAKEWCKSHNQSAKAEEYCGAIRRLLHSNTLEQFEQLLSSVTDTWSATFTQYFTSRLSEDVRMSSKFAVQEAITFDNMSGVTNNASEAVNAAFKQWLSERKCMYEAVLHSYFYQVGKYGDIKKAFSGSGGKFKIKRDAKNSEFIFQSTNDVISELGILTIFGEGKYSNNVTTYKPKNIDIKSTLGLAWWFLRNNRITYVDQDCYVKGLNGRSFHVDANRKFCTCLRPSCSHLQAVLIQQRRKVTKTYPRPKLTKANKVYHPLNRAGMKLSDSCRKRARFAIPAERKPELLKKAKLMASKKMQVEPHVAIEIETMGQESSSHVGQEDVQVEVQSRRKEVVDNKSTDAVQVHLPGVMESSSSVDMPALNIPSVNLCCLTELPTLSAVTAQEVALKIQNFTLTLQDLKTLDENIKRGEEAAMRKINFGFHRGCLSEAVVNAFFSRLANKNICVVPSNYAVLAVEKTTPKRLEAAMKILKDFYWDEIGLVLLPFVRSPQVWNLAAVKITQEGVKIYVIDPRKPMETEELLAKNFHSFLLMANSKLLVDVQICAPPWHLPDQLNPSDSGACVCTYASSFAHELSMISLMSQLEMRTHILSTICGQCVVQCKNDRIYCFVCGSKDAHEAMVSCDVCAQWYHYSCVDASADMSFSERSFTCADFKGKSRSD